MFVESELTWTIAVKPSDLKSGLHIQRALLRKLLADFDKLKCSEKHGYYICVTTLEGIGEGKIWEGKGCVAYKVRFRCLTYRPQKHEKVFAVVTGEPQEKGVMCSFGPIENMYLSSKPMKDQYTFVGASETKPAHFKGRDGSVIETGSVLRVKMIGVKYNSLSRLYDTVCSVSGHYLGVERRIWEDKSKPQAAAGGGADGNEGGVWGCDTQAENGGEDWGACPPKESGGWGAATAEKTNSVGGGDAVPAKSTGAWDDVPAKKADDGGGWDAAQDKKGGGWGDDTATESNGGWDCGPTKKTDNDEGWDASPAEKGSGGGGWGESSRGRRYGGRKNTASGKDSKVNADPGTDTDLEKEDAGGWGSSPAKKSKVGGWASTNAEKESSDFGAWGDPAPKTSCGGWDKVEVENNGGAWGD